MDLMLRVGLLVLALAVSDGIRVKRQAISCIGLGNVRGTCMELRDCTALTRRLTQDRRNAVLIQEIQRTGQVCTNRRSEVCCPEVGAQSSTTSATPAAVRLPTFDDGCGTLNSTISFPKAFGGRVRDIGTWPWLALLGYRTPSGVTFNCGGSIITKRHVLTAAHCIKSNLVLARFGEHDLNNDTETRHVDINIRRCVRHRDFLMDTHAGRNDIAICYMDTDIPFTDLIRPVCLPTTDSLKNTNFVGHQPFVAGWGRTSKAPSQGSSVLQHEQTLINENLECENAYRSAAVITPGENIDDAFLCVGYKTGDHKTCRADSGGPLMAAHLHTVNGRQYYIIQIGVITTGVGCAILNAPNLYTRTSYYMDWIEQKIAEPL